MARQTFKIEGLSDLEETLKELPKATGKAVLRRGLLKAAEPIAASAASNARRRTGKLQISTGVGTKLSRRQKRLHKPESTVEVFAGPGALVQSITEEFGTVDQAPHPFMRPAWDSGKQGALNSVKGFLTDELAKTVARRAAKTAREAAKIKAGK